MEVQVSKTIFHLVMRLNKEKEKQTEKIATGLFDLVMKEMKKE